MSWLPDPAVVGDADVFLIKDCFFCQKQLWGALSSLQVCTITGAQQEKGCSGLQRTTGRKKSLPFQLAAGSGHLSWSCSPETPPWTSKVRAFPEQPWPETRRWLLVPPFQRGMSGVSLTWEENSSARLFLHHQRAEDPER